MLLFFSLLKMGGNTVFFKFFKRYLVMKSNKCYPPRLRKRGIKIKSLNTTSFQG